MLINIRMEIIFCGNKMATKLACFIYTSITFDINLGGHFVSVQDYFTSYIDQHVEKSLHTKNCIFQANLKHI